MNAMIPILLAQSSAPGGREEIYFFVALGLLGLAIVLLILELFLPTAGVLSVLTGVSAVASIASMFAYDVTWGAVYLAILCAGSPIVLVLVFKVWSKTPLARRMVLKEDADGTRHPVEEGDDARTNPSIGATGSAARSTAQQLALLVGHSGIAATTLRPVGFIRIDGARIEGVAESGFIAQGAAVKVIDALEGQLRVREVPQSHPDDPARSP